MLNLKVKNNNIIYTCNCVYIQLFIYIYIYIYIYSIQYILWRVGCLPLIIIVTPSLIRRPSPGSRREWVCERGGENSQVWRRVMRHTWSEWSLITAAVICRARLSSGDRSLVLVGPGRERWATSTAPARRLTGQDAGPYNPWKRRGPKGGRSR